MPLAEAHTAMRAEGKETGGEYEEAVLAAAEENSAVPVVVVLEGDEWAAVVRAAVAEVTEVKMEAVAVAAV